MVHGVSSRFFQLASTQRQCHDLESKLVESDTVMQLVNGQLRRTLFAALPKPQLRITVSLQLPGSKTTDVTFAATDNPEVSFPSVRGSSHPLHGLKCCVQMLARDIGVEHSLDDRKVARLAAVLQSHCDVEASKRRMVESLHTATALGVVRQAIALIQSPTGLVDAQAQYEANGGVSGDVDTLAAERAIEAATREFEHREQELSTQLQDARSLLKAAQGNRAAAEDVSWVLAFS